MGTRNKVTVVLDKKTFADIKDLAERLGLKDEDILKMSITAMLGRVERERTSQAGFFRSEESLEKDE